MPTEHVESVLAKLSTSFSAKDLLIAMPNEYRADSFAPLQIIATPPDTPSSTLTAANFVHAYQLAQKHEARAILMLGPESPSLEASALHALGSAVLTSATDLAVPYYGLRPHSGLITSGILYPLTRTLFASRVRFPQAVDLGLSLRMAEHLANAAQRFVLVKQGEAPLWSVNEATVSGFTIEQFDVGALVQPQPGGPDLNSIFPVIIGSIFSDIEAKAAFWQRPRQLPPARSSASVALAPSSDAPAEIGPMLSAFRLAYSNLYEIWSLVLPPNSLLGLKRLFALDAAAFRIPESLWARIVFDFVVAYKLRTINRGHLLGALIPLYLAWVASHINVTASGIEPEHHIEAVAAAFEADKSYLVSRWRWPDRFNP
jgi:hypothetical protein